MPYSVTKHAAVAVAEWLAITYGGNGSGSASPASARREWRRRCSKPGAARTRARAWRAPPARRSAPTRRREALVEGIAADRFLILSHPEVQTYQQRKAADPERWLGGMQRFQAQIDEARVSRSARGGCA